MSNDVIQICSIVHARLHPFTLVHTCEILSCRYIAVHVVDSDGEESATSTLTVNFSTECTVWPENTIAVPSMVSLAHVGICSSISPSLELSISSSSNIFNLEALKNLKVRSHTPIWCICVYVHKRVCVFVGMCVRCVSVCMLVSA